MWSFQNIKGVEISEADAVPTDEAIDSILDSILTSYATEEDMTDENRAIEETDIVNIDYSGSVDGEILTAGQQRGRIWILPTAHLLTALQSRSWGISWEKNLTLR